MSPLNQVQGQRKIRVNLSVRECESPTRIRVSSTVAVRPAGCWCRRVDKILQKKYCTYRCCTARSVLSITSHSQFRCTLCRDDCVTYRNVRDKIAVYESLFLLYLSERKYFDFESSSRKLMFVTPSQFTGTKIRVCLVYVCV